MFIFSIVPIALTGDTDSVNPSDRLAEIRSKISSAEQRVRDLEAQLTGLILGQDVDVDPTTPGNQPPSGLNTVEHPKGANDPNIVRQELYRARAYEGELRTAENFWNEIVSANKTAESKLHEHFKPA